MRAFFWDGAVKQVTPARRIKPPELPQDRAYRLLTFLREIENG